MPDPVCNLWAEITYELTVKQSGTLTIPLYNVSQSLPPEELIQAVLSQASHNPQVFEAMAENNIIQLDELPKVAIKLHRIYPDVDGAPDIQHPIEIADIQG